MQYSYKVLLIGLSLFIGLPACSQKTVSEKPCASVPTVETDSVATPVQPAILGPAGKDVPPQVKPVLPAKQRAKRLGQVQAARPVRDRTPNAASDTLVQLLAPQASVGVASTSVPTDTAVAKLTQYFRIRADRDTLLMGAEGTTVWVPAHVFEQQHAPVLTGEIEIRLREFYSLADILLQRLATTAGPALLETAGMMQLTATATGQACTVKRGSSLEVGFPTKQVHENMQLFNGVSKPGHALDWQPAHRQWARASRERAWRRPSYPHGYGGMRGHLQRQIPYSAATAERLASQHQPRPVRRWLRHLGQYGPLVGAVAATFEVSASGQLTEVRPLATSDPELTACVQQALHRLTARWRPASTGRGVAVRSQLTVEVLFTADQRVVVEHLWWNEAATHAMYRADQLKSQSLTATQLQGATAPEAASYLFQATNLGWLNCDRFIRFTAPLISQHVALAGPPTDMSLVLRVRRSVLRGSGRANQISFERVPKGEAATLIAIRRDQGQLYLAMRDIVVSQQPEPPLDFKPMTVGELKAAIARLELPVSR
jgi:hypothetical protein